MNNSLDLSNFPKDKYVYIPSSNMKDFLITEVGCQDFKNLKNIRFEHMQPCYSLHYILKGRGKLHMNNNIYYLSQGDFFYIPTNVSYRYYEDSKDPWHYVWILIYGNNIDTLFHASRFSGINPVYSSRNYEKIKGIYEDFFINYQNYINSLSFFANSLFFQIMTVIASERSTERVKEAEHSGIVQKIFDYINVAHSNPNIKIEQLCKMVNISHPHLCRIFKSETSMSMMTYLKTVRLKKAAELLKHSQMSIKEIAYSVGYNDEVHFCKEFKKNYNLTANSFRLKI